MTGNNSHSPSRNTESLARVSPEQPKEDGNFPLNNPSYNGNELTDEISSASSKRKRQTNGRTSQPAQRSKRVALIPDDLTSSWSLKGTPMVRKGNSVVTTNPSPSTTGEHFTYIVPKTDPPSPLNSSYRVNVARNIQMAPRALKACRGCRKSKIKCESNDEAKCKRCFDQGLECVYEIKVPTSSSTVADSEWMSSVESRLNSFGDTLQSILAILKNNNANSNKNSTDTNIDTNMNRNTHMNKTAYMNSNNTDIGDTNHINHIDDMNDINDMTGLTELNTRISEMVNINLSSPDNDARSLEYLSNLTPGSPPRTDSPLFLSTAEEHTIAELAYNNMFTDIPPSPSNEIEKLFADFIPQLNDNERKNSTPDVTDHSLDLRTNGTISFPQAQELFTFFHEKISPYLFGFPISQIALPTVWARSPILVAAICTVAAIHHPIYNNLFDTLKKELDFLSKEILFKQIHTEIETIDTIIALCVAGFWLPDSFMLTAVALRLAKNVGLNLLSGIDRHSQDLSPPSINKDRLRLWYLLYTLDGHQALTFEKHPLINPEDISLAKSRQLLLNKPVISSNNLTTKEELFLTPSPVNSLADMRLVSQVEFNQAVKSIFQERGWDLLKPSNIGIPWQTNLDLDKWMVSWACMLTPSGNGDGSSWPSKSTLIHYNYAMMHINSSAIRDIQAHGKLGDVNGGNIAGGSDALAKYFSSSSSSTASSSSSSSSSLLSSAQSDSIAISAAQNVLKMSTTDKDILSALRYVPIHVHMMLYYAALLLLHSLSSSSSPKLFRSTLTLVRNLRSTMLSCSSGRQQLTSKIIDSLGSAITLKAKELEYNIQEEDHDENDITKRTITGWPGSVASHMR